MSKRVAILGSTGSIGCSALDVIAHLGEPFRVAALSAHRQTDKLRRQAERFSPPAIALTDPAAAADCRPHQWNGGNSTQFYTGSDGLVEMVQRDDIDIVLAAIVGSAGLPACLAAVEAGKTLALANKEALVVAGSLLIPEARKRNVPILPVDSEHSAVFQALHCGRRDEIRRIILTASGGPFRTASLEKIQNATIEDALNHPTWRMGSKITIDSATMFNKALEVIEACWLFDLPPEKVEIVVHPESMVHSMVEFVDGSVMAQLSPPDMRTPIQYALTYPARSDGIARRLDLAQAFSLHFEPPDFERFPALRLAYDVAKQGGAAGAVLNAANETAVAAFLAGKISFGTISRIVEQALQSPWPQKEDGLEGLMAADQWARKRADSLIQQNPARK